MNDTRWPLEAWADGERDWRIRCVIHKTPKPGIAMARASEKKGAPSISKWLLVIEENGVEVNRYETNGTESGIQEKAKALRVKLDAYIAQKKIDVNQPPKRVK